ncbi:unnamed protein product [Rhizoctonia solani]|uniref:F-box domain-containing protein n=1 Tax=Rhizoctonia solani TaxID=456999 RepID=A0A8H3CS44_9AGAM|nr:unnamed protein product [Rhizoctonia solani]
MIDTPTQSLSNWVDQWEAAGTNLAGALATYLDCCLSLTNESVKTALDTKYLVSRIDYKLESLHVELEQRISQSRWTLARMRNKLAGTVYSIPEEILAEIFTLVVYNRSDHEIQFVEDDIGAFYHRLHTLLAVCTAWRKVGMSHGTLWALIPMLSRKSGWVMQPATELSYQRAGGRELYLGASIEKHVDGNFIKNIRRNFHRFRSINVVFDDKRLLSRAIYSLFKREPVSNSLTELSLYHFLGRSEEFGLNIPDADDFLTSLRPHVPFSTSIDQTVQALHVLRLKNIHIHWHLMTLPKLVELRIESVMVGTKANLRQLLLALLTAPQLQKLELISLTTEPNPDGTTILEPPSVPLPNLQRLYLGDVYSDDAEMILRSITGNPYCMTLYLTLRMGSIVIPEGPVQVGLDRLMSVLQGVKVDTLLLQGDEVWENWFGLNDFRRLLLIMPFITTLKIDSWEFGQSGWEALTRPDDGTAFANLRNVHLSNLQLRPLKENISRSLEGFLSSHPIHHLTLGGFVRTPSPPRLEWVSIKDYEPITHRLRSMVPELQLLDDGYIPSEFRTHHWELW